MVLVLLSRKLDLIGIKASPNFIKSDRQLEITMNIIIIIISIILIILIIIIADKENTIISFITIAANSIETKDNFHRVE